MTLFRNPEFGKLHNVDDVRCGEMGDEVSKRKIRNFCCVCNKQYDRARRKYFADMTQHEYERC